MRLSLRFVIPLIVVLALLAYAVNPLVDALTLKWFVRDLESRSKLIAGTMEGPVADLLAANSKTKLANYLQKVMQDERLYAIGICGADGRLLFKTSTYPSSVSCEQGGDRFDPPGVRVLPHGRVHVATTALEGNGQQLGRLVLIHDMSWVDHRSTDTKWYVFYLFLVIGIVISSVTVLIAHLSWKGWIAGVRGLLRRSDGADCAEDHGPELEPVARDLRLLIRELEADRRLKDESQVSWTADMLRTILLDDLAGEEVLVVSNRQPYIHNRRGDHVEVQVPASGLVTALEPIMRACSGVWIAQGNGSADREVVDERDHVSVPPDDPAYVIRRIWMSAEEEKGYYYGFANEGLWPLSHVAHVRPVFRSADWKQYQAINARFAWAVLEEAKTDNPIVLVQDYHLALVPQLIRQQMPNATVITFWHIPWPNAERFSICPWREELLEGLLGSRILGFHTRLYCSNFFDSADRLLEARIDRDLSVISYGGKLTAVNAYPISIEWPSRLNEGQPPVTVCRSMIRSRHGLDESHRLAIGIERLDYTKGLLERFLAIERLLELHPEWIGRFSLIQIAAPSRSVIPQYQQLANQVVTLVETINGRFGRPPYEPIILKIVHHEPAQIQTYYRGSDVCLVTSLHDGMNLVAKEFIAARDDEQGVLVLSQFTGAAGELPEALIVNPYDSDQCAEAIHRALTMTTTEQRARMRSMRRIVQDFNVFRWAGRMLLDAARMRQRERVLRHGHRQHSPRREEAAH